MKIGKITFKVENIGGSRYLFCRPIASPRIRFKAVPGNQQVVYVEKNIVSEQFEVNKIYETYALFQKSEKEEVFKNGICNVKCTPIFKETYDILKNIVETENDLDHAFICERN